MRRINRDLVLFSMSALDLFASALGAFILVTIVLLPYYLKHDDVVNDQERLRQQNMQLQQKLAAISKQLEESQKSDANRSEKLKAMLAQLQALKAEAKSLEERLRQARKVGKNKTAIEKQLEATQKALKRAQAEIERRVKFALLGLSTNAQSFVVVVDMSNSMRRFEGITLDTVRRVLAPMSRQEQVGIIGFQASQFQRQTKLFYWPRAGSIAPMTPDNKKNAVSYVTGLLRRVSGLTPTMAGLMEALKYDVDAIVLLSDGAPTVPDDNWRRVVRVVTTANQGKKEIHTVALGPYFRHSEFVAFLSQLSKANRGNFTGIAAP